MASFSPLVTAGSSLAQGMPKPGAVIKPPKPISGIAQAGTGLLKSQAPKAPKPGVSAAGSGALNLAGQLTGGSTPTAQATGGANAPAPSAGSPLDSTYYNDVANYLFKTNNSINADTLAQGNDQTALSGALGQLAYQQPRDTLKLEQGANAGGGLFSSVYNQNLGDLGQKYLTAQNNDTTKYGGDIQKLAAAISALQGSIPLEENSEALASAARAAAAAQANPSLGAPPAPAASAPATAKVNGKTVPNTIIARALAGHPTWGKK